MQQLNEDLLSDYMDSFLGYGNIQGSYWFVGMEEGGGKTCPEIAQRITQWENRGKQPLEDLFEYHLGINELRWFGRDARLQPTWNRLIRILLASKGMFPDKEQVRAYQSAQLGRHENEVGLLELFPLPSQSRSTWIYPRCSRNLNLRSREEYERLIGPKRAQKFHNLILEHRPAFVIFYGLDHMDWWRKIADTRMKAMTVQKKTAYFGRMDTTIFAAVQHPVARGITHAYFHEIGQMLRKIEVPQT